ncbi:antA/AntB antirepressor family protein [Caloranaerobacter ferrireducens]|uniref:antA/AntB antirepressor family protein n=1 Tax=Caloranaerobacter ferrireducens TaxID=1323370 RepID=UPI00084D82A2|nr:antA/AntB antirepressor family protein [Caloranaerobacter ferrireducens]
MNDLTVVENGLIPIYQNQKGERLVDARELHEFLEVKSKFADWIKNRIDKYGFIENLDYVTVSKILENGGRTKEYILKIDTAKEIAMVENNLKGRLVRRYFIEVEKKFREMQKPTCIEDVLIQSLQEMKQMRLQIEQARQEIAATQTQVATIKDTLIQRDKNWRDWTNSNVKNIGAKLGDYKRAWNESYQELEKRARCNLERRLENYITRLLEAGATKRKIKNACYLDVIEQDTRLKEIYTNIVKELVIKYLD